MKSILTKDGLVDEVKKDVSARLRVIKASKFRNLSWVVMPLDTGFLSCFMVNTSQRKIMGQLLLFCSSRQDLNISSHCRSNRPFSIYILNIQLESEALRAKTIETRWNECEISYISSTFLCLCPHCLTIRLNLNISKKAYCLQKTPKKCQPSLNLTVTFWRTMQVANNARLLRPKKKEKEFLNRKTGVVHIQVENALSEYYLLSFLSFIRSFDTL